MGGQQSVTTTTPLPGSDLPEIRTAKELMKAWVPSRNGDLSAAQVVSIPIPKPNAGDVRIRIVCAAVNLLDAQRAQAVPPSRDGVPNVIGVDGAGIVDELGPEVGNVAVGDRVHFLADPRRPYGTFAEYVVVPAASVATHSAKC